MTSPDIVFGPPGVIGDWACPDCHAGPRQLCHWWCPRYGENPSDDWPATYPTGDEEGDWDGS